MLKFQEAFEHLQTFFLMTWLSTSERVTGIPQLNTTFYQIDGQ
jgi:hypothetical protein